MHGRPVRHRDELGQAADARVDLPVVSADVRKRGPLGGGAVSNEPKRVAGERTIAKEVRNHVTVRLAGVEDEYIVPRTACQVVQTRPSVQDVSPSAAIDGVGQLVPG